jgi:hypothetical protein
MSERRPDDEEAKRVLRKYRAGYLAHHPEAPGPELLAQMTPLEAMVILEDESHALYDGSSGGGPAANHAWEVLWVLAEEHTP